MHNVANVTIESANLHAHCARLLSLSKWVGLSCRVALTRDSVDGHWARQCRDVLGPQTNTHLSPVIQITKAVVLAEFGLGNCETVYVRPLRRKLDVRT